jgi:hypothetical protein
MKVNLIFILYLVLSFWAFIGFTTQIAVFLVLADKQTRRLR